MGLSENNLVVLKPDSEEDYPFYYYDFINNEIGCEISEVELNFIQKKNRFEGNQNIIKLDGWWARNDRATLTLNGRNYVGYVTDYWLGVRNDDLDDRQSHQIKWGDKLWKQISERINQDELVDNQGNKITASVSGNQIMINSKSQDPLDIKIVAYNDAGGNNTKPRFLREQKIIPPKRNVQINLNFNFMRSKLQKNISEGGFTLLELIIVLILISILSAISTPLFKSFIRKVHSAAAKTSITNIKKECTTNKDLQVQEFFTPIEIRGYSVKPISSSSCFGDVKNNLISLVPNDSENPIYTYDHILGK